MFWRGQGRVFNQKKKNNPLRQGLYDQLTQEIDSY